MIMGAPMLRRGKVVRLERVESVEVTCNFGHDHTVDVVVEEVRVWLVSPDARRGRDEQGRRFFLTLGDGWYPPRWMCHEGPVDARWRETS